LPLKGGPNSGGRLRVGNRQSGSGGLNRIQIVGEAAAAGTIAGMSAGLQAAFPFHPGVQLINKLTATHRAHVSILCFS
jgi:hypothetical protein